MAEIDRRRIAVIADAHGNSHALRAVLEDVLATGVGETIVLGDMINGLDPSGTLAVACDCGRLPVPACRSTGIGVPGGDCSKCAVTDRLP
jgi:hypothetical protein